MPFLYNDFVKKTAAKFDRIMSDMEAVYNFDSGDEFELAICDMLRSILPQRFGICRGFVVSENGSVAGDDIIIYEQQQYPTFRQVEKFGRKEQIPIEAVFAYHI